MKLFENLSKFSTSLEDLNVPSFNLIDCTFCDSFSFTIDTNGYCHPADDDDDYWAPSSFRFLSEGFFYFVFQFDSFSHCYRIPVSYLQIFTADVWFCNIYFSFLHDFDFTYDVK